MIGQNELLNTIDDLVSNNIFPRFTILVGPRGSGKKLLCNYIGDRLKGILYNTGIKVEDIRKCIQDSYKLSNTTIYMIQDADTMSIAAKNALLKVTEEPPNNAYYIMTLTNDNNTLATIRSRATLLYLKPYSTLDIENYYVNKYGNNEKELSIIKNICGTPGEVDLLKKNNVLEFTQYVKTVVENIALVSGANSFKIADKISFKDEEDKYDLILFWKAFMVECTNRFDICSKEDILKYCDGIRITSQNLQDLRITGINKQATFDNWLLDIREKWMEVESDS